MYLQFVTQAKVWIDQNPDADIRLASIGFSRGAEQAAGFTRMVEGRGIQDPRDAIVTRGRDGLIDRVEYTQPPLRAPGSVVQAAALLDPVGTGEPREHDRRLAASVVSGFQITAADERRNLFQSTRVMDPGMTEDDRFLNVAVAGAHSNVGGSYRLNGLAMRSGNLTIDYLNSLSSEPFLDKQKVRPDPARDVIHRSQDHQFFYRTSVFDRNGGRGHQEDLAPTAFCPIQPIDCRDAIPRNEAMAAGLTWRPVQIGPVPGEPSPAYRTIPALLSGCLRQQSAGTVRPCPRYRGITCKATPDRRGSSPDASVCSKSRWFHAWQSSLWSGYITPRRWHVEARLRLSQSRALPQRHRRACRTERGGVVKMS